LPAASDYLADLTGSELRDVALALGIERVAYPRKAELIDSILRASSAKKAAQMAERVEALGRLKHVWLFSLDAEVARLGPEELSTRLWPNAPGSHFGFNSRADDFYPTLQFTDQWTDSLYVKLTHWVQSDMWESVSPTRKELVKSRVRHPVTLVFHTNTGVMEVRFNGYSQALGTPKPKRMSYEVLVSRVTECVQERLDAPLAGLRIREAIADILVSRPEEVIDVRRVVSPDFGGRLIFDAAQEAPELDVPHLLSRFFHGVAGEFDQDLEPRIRSALASSPADSQVLAWKDPAILTRIAFYEIAPELLFIWRGEDRTETAVANVVSTLFAHISLQAPDVSAAFNSILTAPAGDLIRATDLAESFNLSSKAAYTVLEEARRRSIVERCFRVRSTMVLDVDNRWRTSLEDLPERAVDEEGEEIDVLDPINVEVGFKRVEGGAHVD
jgi:hypothetical protein